MTTIFFYVLLFQIKDWDKICEEEGKMTSPIICYILLGVILFIILMRILLCCIPNNWKIFIVY